MERYIYFTHRYPFSINNSCLSRVLNHDKRARGAGTQEPDTRITKSGHGILEAVQEDPSVIPVTYLSQTQREELLIMLDLNDQLTAKTLERKLHFAYLFNFVATTPNTEEKPGDFFLKMNAESGIIVARNKKELMAKFSQYFDISYDEKKSEEWQRIHLVAEANRITGSKIPSNKKIGADLGYMERLGIVYSIDISKAGRRQYIKLSPKAKFVWAITPSFYKVWKAERARLTEALDAKSREMLKDLRNTANSKAAPETLSKLADDHAKRYIEKIDDPVALEFFLFDNYRVSSFNPKGSVYIRYKDDLRKFNI